MASVIKRGGLGLTLGGLLFAVLAVLNYLSARHFFHRYDLTKAKEFTVAEPSRKILRELADVVNVRAYFSPTLPDQVAAIPAQVRDQLAELEAFAHGKLRVEILHPDDSPETEAKLRALGIPKFPISIIARDKQETVAVYLGMVISYADQRETIPVVGGAMNFEYEMMSAILRLTQPRKKVAFLTGNGERDPERELAVVKKALERQYEVTSVDLSGGKMVPDDVATLIVAGPGRALDEWARYAFDQFVMRGGHALCLIDMEDVDPQLAVHPKEHGLDTLLAHYGVALGRGLVADFGMSEIVQLPSDDMSEDSAQVVQYPLWPKLVVENIAEDSPIVNRLPTLVLPWTSPVTPVKDVDGVKVLASSSQYATVEDKLYSAHPRALPERDETTMKPVPLMVAVNSPLTSFWKGKETPLRPALAAPSTEDQDLVATPPPVEPLPPRIDGIEHGLLVVVGSSSFATDQMLRQRSFGSNLSFVQNAVDWLTMGEALLGIRSRTSEPPLLDPARVQLGAPLAKIFNLAVVPLLVAMFGILRRMARKSREATPAAAAR